MKVIENEKGNYTISPKVFKDIAQISLDNNPDVCPGKKDDYIGIKFDDNDNLTVNVSLRLKQGCDVIKTCSRLQDNIKDNLNLMAGVECANINIDIQGFTSK
ncbi:MAG: Asp23/Gls24 family envelope stress response protein [Erysipelotrichaceae bacterium]|nr:Asp23/Gls24 family envelope stress response protein [Erysipelotrichaceae bacterium]